MTYDASRLSGHFLLWTAIVAAATVLVKRERAFSCYQNTAGEWVCDIFAAANTNAKDKSESIDKPRS